MIENKFERYKGNFYHKECFNCAKNCNVNDNLINNGYKKLINCNTCNEETIISETSKSLYCNECKSYYIIFAGTVNENYTEISLKISSDTKYFNFIREIMGRKCFTTSDLVKTFKEIYFVISHSPFKIKNNWIEVFDINHIIKTKYHSSDRYLIEDDYFDKMLHFTEYSCKITYKIPTFYATKCNILFTCLKKINIFLPKDIRKMITTSVINLYNKSA
tara:strand:+ start:175 stop:828 length:654 start_codon:yes stop_codon:yes gene_type:complete